MCGAGFLQAVSLPVTKLTVSKALKETLIHVIFTCLYSVYVVFVCIKLSRDG